MVLSQVCLPQQNGLLPGVCPSPSSPSRQLNPHPPVISTDSWRLAERATGRIIRRIQPTRVADRRRREVIEYVRRLIRGVAEAEIFPFGSVPLKTYLPDGDIDLTAIERPRADDTLAKDVQFVLQAEEQNRNAEFEVKDVQYIHAEVKLVKCLVQNIVVDISFQQAGGLCTLCFLEKVDHVIGKNHLFKRSIILIKAWCYYESRILGAHHGLISTYALETLVLYIFQFFHTSLNGPLAVLYHFLDYFSKFDWDNYCISLNGSVCISSLPEIMADSTETDGGDLLLSRKFLKSCSDAYTSFQGSDNNFNRLFLQKHLNIVDPLKASNNLGRSVSRGNFYRIRSAFTYGAKKLGRILMLPGERIADELDKFFMNTLDRHGSGERPDVQDTGSSFPDSTLSDLNGSEPELSNFTFEEDYRGGMSSGSSSINFHGGLFEDINILMGVELGKQAYNHQLGKNHIHGCIEAQCDSATEGNVLAGISQDKGGVLVSRKTNGTCQSLLCSSEVGCPSSGKVRYAPHIFFQENGNVESGNPEQTKGIVSETSMNNLLLISDEGNSDAELSEGDVAATSGYPVACVLSNLTGEYMTHLRNFLYAMQCLDRQSHSRFYSKPPWDPHGQLNVFPHLNGMIPSPKFSHASGFYPLNVPFIASAYGLEELPRTRGTGTYFPLTNHHSYGERRSPGRGRNPVLVSQMPRPRNKISAVNPPENLTDIRSSESPSHTQLIHVSVNGCGRPSQLESSQASSSVSRGFPQTSGVTFPVESRLEFGYFGPVRPSAPSPEPLGKLDSNGFDSQGCGTTVHNVGTNESNERPRQSYHLKDEVDFPPLSSLGQLDRE